MTQNNDSTKLAELLEEITGSENPMFKMLVWACQELMEAEVTHQLNASKSERSGERNGYRSGYRSRRLDTLLGTLNLLIPKVREGGYTPSFLAHRQRSEQALICAIQEMYISGVSTRKISKLVKDLGIEGLSASEVSNIAKGLDEQVKAFRERRLNDHIYPILWVDALYEKVRVGNTVVSMAIEVVCGVNEDGKREVLAIEPMPEESKESYLALFRGLRERGMNVPKLVISDAHAGLVAAIREGLAGASWQRCKVHFMRNILAYIPQNSKDEAAKDLKRIWLQETAEDARKVAKAFVEKYQKRCSKAAACLEEGLEDSLTFFSFPMIDSKKIASSNMIERLNEEIRRRTRVVGIFPNEASYIRLVTSLLLEYAEDWSCGHAYINKEALAKMTDPDPGDASA